MTPTIDTKQAAADTKPTAPAAQPRPDVIAMRKTCDAEGTGLSHYVLMDKPVKR
jgi:modified peptide precursor CbpA